MLHFICANPSLLSGSFNILFLSSFIVDILANVSRIFLKYVPALLCRHAFMQRTLAIGMPLATAINASEWYLSYAMVFCAFFFQVDHLVLVLVPNSYGKLCNPLVRRTMVCLTWTLPLIWILPMLSNCCRSKFLEGSASPVFVEPEVQQVYDGVDMFVEAFIYVPTVFTLNFISTCVLHKRYFNAVRSRVFGLASLGMYLSKTIPGLSGIRQRCDTHDAPEYLRVLQRPSTGKGGTILVRRRILDELNISFISLLDQMIDAVGIIFYLIFWGTNLGLGVHIMDARTALGFYDFCWEMSTISQPYLFLLIFPKVRRHFFEFYGCKRHQ